MTPPTVSFEFFPPKSLEASFRLWDTLGVLAPLDPQFVSVTYGAGGTTRALTHDAVKTIHKNYGVSVAAHLTCVDATREETLEIAESYAEAGVTEIVALRGDPPKGQGRFTPHAQGFAGSVELVEALAKTGKFTLRVGAYPDPHPEAATMQDCVDHLKRKMRRGRDPPPSPSSSSRPRPSSASADACAASGIQRPSSPASCRSIRGRASANSPRPAAPSFPHGWTKPMKRRSVTTRERLLSTALCTELCAELVDGGVDALHFYTLNTPDLTREVCAALGVGPPPRVETVGSRLIPGPSGLSSRPGRDRVHAGRQPREQARPCPSPSSPTGPADMADSATILSMSGLDFMQRVADGTLPQAPPIARLLNFRVTRRLGGRSVFHGAPLFRSSQPDERRAWRLVRARFWTAAWAVPS